MAHVYSEHDIEPANEDNFEDVLLIELEQKKYDVYENVRCQIDLRSFSRKQRSTLKLFTFYDTA